MTAVPAFAWRSSRHREAILAVGSLVLIIALWQLLTATLAGHSPLWPTPWQIVSTMHIDGWQFYWINTRTTVIEAAEGFVWGNLLAIAIAALIVMFPIVGRPLLRVSVVLNCLPIVAIGPILAILFTGQTFKVALAGLAVFFTTLIGTLVGLRSADQTSLDLVQAYGGTTWHQLSKVRLRAALPSLFGALRIAGPAAVLGAIIGEYIGGNQGLGVAMINSEQSLEISRTWGIALAATAVGAVAYGVAALIGRALTPWATAITLLDVGSERAPSYSGNLYVRGAKAVVSTVGRAVLTLVLVLVGWLLFLKLFSVSPFIGKTPLDVWRYLFTSNGAGGHRGELLRVSATTLRDAGLGLVAGTVVALVTAWLMVIIPTLQSVIMPFAMVLRSVPLVAMTPLIVGIFGRNLQAVTIIAGLITYFPTLVNVTLALRRTPRGSMDLLEAYGAGPLRILMKVQVPTAIPALFGALRVSAPLALTGALLAEWLATGAGLGNEIILAQAQSEYGLLWSAVVLATIYAVLLYNGIGLAERLVMRRFGTA